METQTLKQTTGPREFMSVLCEQIDALRANATTPARANAVNSLVSTGIRTKKLELDILKLSGQKPPNDFLQIAGNSGH